MRRREGDPVGLGIGRSKLWSGELCELREQLDELIAGEVSAFDDPQRQPTSQIAVVPGHNHTAIIAGTPQNDVAARLVVNLEAGRSKARTT